MSDGTKIEWTDATWTAIRARYDEIQDDGSGKERIGWHCEHVSEGCRNCYAERLNRRIGTGLDFKPGNLWRADRVGYNNGETKLFLDEKMLAQPLRWRRPRRIFVCSMTDLFADFVPDEWIDKVFAVMALAPQHTFQVLTKRPGRMRDYLSDEERLGFAICNAAAKIIGRDPGEAPAWPLPNVWLGVSVEDQARADERIPLLLDTPAAVRWISAEPLLGPTDVRDHLKRECSGRYLPAMRGVPLPSIDWVVAGSESGPGARHCDLDWVRSLRDQCEAAGCAFFWKQHSVNGKKISAPSLDGKQWLNLPA